MKAGYLTKQAAAQISTHLCVPLPTQTLELSCEIARIKRLKDGGNGTCACRGKCVGRKMQVTYGRKKKRKKERRHLETQLKTDVQQQEET